MALNIQDRGDLPRQIRFPDAGAWVFHAPSGAAKSLLFDLIVAAKERIGPYGVTGSTPWPVQRGPARVTLRLAIDDEERDFAALTKGEVEATVQFGPPADLDEVRQPPGLVALLRRASGVGAGRFELIPSERSIIGSPPGGGVPGRAQQMLLLSSHVKKFAGIPSRLVDLARDDQPEFSAFRQAFDALAPRTKCLGLRRDGEGATLAFASGSRTLLLSELGLDEHQYLLFAALAAMAPKQRCIVMLDEPELHLSETAACRLVQAFAELLGAKTQLLIGTRLEAVVGAVAASSVLRWQN